jgi:hypothetical protein
MFDFEMLGFLLLCAQSKSKEANEAPPVFKRKTLLLWLGILGPSLEDLFDHCNILYEDCSLGGQS